MKPTTENSKSSLLAAARSRAAVDGAKLLESARAESALIGEMELKCFNRIIEAGQQFNVCCGREQMLFTLAGEDFARREILPHLPAGMGLEHVRAAVKLARRYPEQLETVAELVAVRKEWQQTVMVFWGCTNKRRELQNAQSLNLFASLIDMLQSFRLLLKKIEASDPVAQWDAEKASDFIDQAKPLMDAVVIADQIRRGTPTPPPPI